MSKQVVSKTKSPSNRALNSTKETRDDYGASFVEPANLTMASAAPPATQRSPTKTINESNLINNTTLKHGKTNASISRRDITSATRLMSSRVNNTVHSYFNTSLFEKYTEAIYDCHELESKIEML